MVLPHVREMHAPFPLSNFCIPHMCFSDIPRNTLPETNSKNHLRCAKQATLYPAKPRAHVRLSTLDGKRRFTCRRCAVTIWIFCIQNKDNDDNGVNLRSSAESLIFSGFYCSLQVSPLWATVTVRTVWPSGSYFETRIVWPTGNGIA